MPQRTQQHRGCSMPSTRSACAPSATRRCQSGARPPGAAAEPRGAQQGAEDARSRMLARCRMARWSCISCSRWLCECSCTIARTEVPSLAATVVCGRRACWLAMAAKERRGSGADSRRPACGLTSPASTSYLWRAATSRFQSTRPPPWKSRSDTEARAERGAAVEACSAALPERARSPCRPRRRGGIATWPTGNH